MPLRASTDERRSAPAKNHRTPAVPVLGFCCAARSDAPGDGSSIRQTCFLSPPLVIERGQFFGRRPERIKDGSHQPVNRFGVGYALGLIVNDANSYAFRFVPRILLGRIDGAEIRAIAQSFVNL